MDVLKILVIVSTILIFLFFVWEVLNWIWISPKKIEKMLKSKGFKGNPYRFLNGDLKDTEKLLKEAKSKPINFTHDITPRVIPFINNLVHDYGKKTYTWIGPTNTVFILEPDQIKEILSKNYVFLKPQGSPFVKLLAQGVGTYDKDKWSKHRKLINPAFHLEKLKLMLPAFYMSCNEMLNKWDAKEEQSCFELDVWPYLQTLSSDAISRTAFGSNYEEGRKIFELQKELAGHILQLVNTVYIPGMQYLPTKRARRMKAISEEVRKLILSLIDGRMKAIREKGSSGNDLLGILLESNLKEINEHGSKKSGMSLGEVIGECKLFYFAGQETTATMLVWTMILLGKYVDWQNRARDEIRQVFGENKPDYEGLSRLKVMSMIFYEVLRLYPPIVMLRRMIYEDTTLGDLTLPAGVHLNMPAILLHHDENIWGADAKEFKPERFSEGVMKATKGQNVYFPFGSGPRVCIGQTFAMLEAKMAMSLILQRFSFETSALYAHAPYALITILQPQHGAQLVLHKL